MPYNAAIYQFLIDHFKLQHRFIIDIGASDGVFSVEMAKIYDDVLLIDPIEEYTPYRQLPKNCTALKLAVSNYDGVATLKIPRRKSGNHIFPFSTLSDDNDLEAWRYLGYDHCEHRHTDVKTLDSLVKDKQYMDAVKIDVEGHEYSILEGAQNTLKTCPLWIIEIASFLNPYYHRIFNHMISLGFDTYYIKENMMIKVASYEDLESLQKANMIDYIFIKNR